MSTISSSFPRIPTIYYTDLPAPSRRASNVPFLASASRIHHTTSLTNNNTNNYNNMSMSSAVSLMPRHNISMIRPSRTISMPVRQTPKRVPLPLLTVPSQAPLTSTTTSTSSSYSTYASGYGGARSGRRNAPVMSYASAASPSSSSASASPPGRTSIASTSTAPSQILSPSTTLAQEQREARAKAVAVLLLNRAGLSGRRRRTYFGPRQYVRSGLSSCVVVAEEGVDGEGGMELVGGEMEKVSAVEVNA